MAKRSKGPSLRLLPSLQMAPPEAQIANRHAMKSAWRDPEDSTPSAARTAREITGYRQFDPLRRCLKQHGDRCGITEEHIIAADVLRRVADGTVIGFSPGRDYLLPISSIHYRPSTGPSVTARRQERCWRTFVRAVALFDSEGVLLLVHIVLLNWSIGRWCRARHEAGLPADARKEMGRLVAMLDALTGHFAPEVETEIGRGAAA